MDSERAASLVRPGSGAGRLGSSPSHCFLLRSPGVAGVSECVSTSGVGLPPVPAGSLWPSPDVRPLPADVPSEQRLQAVQAAVLLLADESREVLHTLLCFLKDVVHSVQENQMTPMNLAVCLAPSLFHLNLLKKESSPRWVFPHSSHLKPNVTHRALKKETSSTLSALNL